MITNLIGAEIGVNDTVYSPCCEIMEKDGVYLALDSESPNWVSMNAQGAEIFRLCDGRHTIRSIISSLVEKWEGGKLDLSAKILQFLGDLEKRGMISKSRFQSKEYLGREKQLLCNGLSELWLYLSDPVRCNLKCKHCFTTTTESVARTELSSEEIQQLISQAKSLGCRTIFFTGGEPFLRRDILDLAGFATVKKSMHLVILTNGTLLTSETVQDLSKIPNLQLQISLDGATEETNDRIRGKGSYQKIMTSLSLLSQAGVPTTVTTTLLPDNIDETAHIMDLLANKKIKALHLLWLHKVGRAAENELTVEADKITGLLRNMRDKMSTKPFKVDNIESYRRMVKYQRGTKLDLCNACYDSINIDSNGNVYPCVFLNRNERYLMGNIRETPIKQIWLESEVGRQFRQETVGNLPKCRDCSIKYLCGGGCLANASTDGIDEYCKVHYQMITDSIWEAASPTDPSEISKTAGPTIFSSMSDRIPSCELTLTTPIDPSHRIRLSHCNCVLTSDTGGSTTQPIRVFDHKKVEIHNEPTAKDVAIRWLITKDMGAENFAMRQLEIGPDGETPYHQHPWEHEVFVTEGKGILKSKNKEWKFQKGDCVFIPPNIEHQLFNHGKEKVRFLCLIPYAQSKSRATDTEIC